MLRSLIILFLFYFAVFAQEKIVILHTNNLNATLENCICPDHPFGSIEKIKPLVDKIRLEEKNVLFVDTGDMLSAFADLHKDKTMISALSYLNYDAVTVGDQEFIHGLEFFESVFLKKGFPVVSANLSEKSPSYLIKKFGSVKIGIIGITSPDAFKFFPEDKLAGITIGDLYNTLNKVLNEIVSKVDMVVLLSHSGLDEDKKIAEKYPQINLIIGGHSQNTLKQGEKVNNTLITQAGGDGYYLGRIDISLNKSKSIESMNAHLITVGIELKNDEKIVEIIKKFDYSFIEKAVSKHKFLQPVPESYIINDEKKCIDCHEKEYESWKKSAHAHSWQSLVNEKKTKSMACISCHVSGFGRLDGFINENITHNLKNVTCVECHYTELSHLTMKTKKTVKKIEEKNCIRCHDKENDADFNFKEAVSRIRH